MKFQITFKDPDGVSNSIKEIVKEQLSILDVDDDERDLLKDSRTEKINDFLGQWLRYSEYVTIEFDTEMGTATVLERSRY